MGKASSAKKVARAARAGGGRRRQRRDITFPATVSVVVVLGVMLVLFARAGEDDADAAPRIGEHIHVAYGVYICDNFVPPFTDQQGDRLGIHTHQDGIIHVHPTSSAAAGKNGKLDVFADEVGLEISDDRLKLPNGQEYENGDKCGDRNGIMQIAEWSSPQDETPRVVTSDLADVRLGTDRSAITIAFAPRGTELPKPPSIPTLDNLSDVGPGATAPSVPGAVPDPTATVPGAPTSTPPAGEPSVTSAPPAGAPPGVTPTTAAPPPTSAPPPTPATTPAP